MQRREQFGVLSSQGAWVRVAFSWLCTTHHARSYQLSNVKKPGRLGYIGVEILPSYVGIV